MLAHARTAGYGLLRLASPLKLASNSWTKASSSCCRSWLPTGFRQCQTDEQTSKRRSQISACSLSTRSRSRSDNNWQQSRGPIWATATALLFSQSIESDDNYILGNRETKMLLKSRQELAVQPPQNWVQYILFALRRYLFEPVLTALRFIHLLTIFVPILASTPLLLLPPTASVWFWLLRCGLELAGSSFIKLGQWAASRADIFPETMCEELGKLHSNGQPHEFRHTRDAIQRAYGESIESVFSEFSRIPTGAGAMGQVYKATLKEDGSEVMVKVLHPRIEETVSRDIWIMMGFANFLDKLPTMEWLSIPGEVQTFANMMQSQLDLRIEALNLDIFQKNFEDHPDVAFPKPYLERTTRNVMVEERVRGVSMETILANCTQNALERRIATAGLDAFLKMLLIDNFIHSDLHAGNIFVRLYRPASSLLSREAQLDADDISSELAACKSRQEWRAKWDSLTEEGYKPQMYFIDAGLVTELEPRNQRNFFDLFKAIALFDGYEAGELMIARSRTPETAIDADVFAMRTEKLVSQIKSRTFALGSVSIGDLLTNMMSMVRKHHVRMESDFITVVLSILLLEGIGRRLDPDLDIFQSALPVIRAAGRLQSSAVKGSADYTTEDLIQMARIWLMLETRQFFTASIQEIEACVKYDLLSPNR